MKTQRFALRNEISNQNTQHHADENPEIKLRVKRLSVHARRLSP
jgi:hypothetical protein